MAGRPQVSFGAPVVIDFEYAHRQTTAWLASINHHNYPFACSYPPKRDSAQTVGSNDRIVKLDYFQQRLRAAHPSVAGNRKYLPLGVSS